MPSIMFYDNEEIPKISLSALKYLSTQLSDFLDLYGKKVLMTDEEKIAYKKLRIISNLLKERHYSDLIADPNLIDFEDDADDYLPEYLPL